MYTQLYPNLFKPLKIRDLSLKNRIMSAPNMLFHTVDGRPTDYYIRYLEHKARGGAGIVTLGEICVCDGGNHTPGMDCSRDNLPLFAEMAAAIHEHGAAASVELTHGGQNARPQFNKSPMMGPCETVNSFGAKIRAMTAKDMEFVADAFADSTEFWLGAGFDTVLLHMAHGWLFTQFLSPLVNKRTDEYGGSLENRMRFPLMVLKRLRERVGQKHALMIRLSGSERRPDGFCVDDIITFLERAQEYIDLAEISTENLTDFFTTTYMPKGRNTDLSEAIKKSGSVKIPIYTIGAVLSPGQSEEIIASGMADGVSMSRALIADPYLPKKAQNAKTDEIIPCLRCLNCTDSDNLKRHFICSVNPLIGREARLGFADTNRQAAYTKKVLVIGGGPAGMQAAITAADCGHEVILCEMSDSLGGLLRFSDYDSFKQDLRDFKNYLVESVKRRDIDIRLNTKADCSLVESVCPDSIIIASGGVPLVPGIKGIEGASHASEVYFNPGALKGESAVIIGGGLVGVETGLHLANCGKKVTVLELQSDYAANAGPVYRMGLSRIVSETGLEIITNANCVKVTDGSVFYEKEGKTHTVHGDTILYAAGMRSDDALYHELYNKAPHVELIGDCKKAGKVDGAVHSGFFAALDIGLI